MNPNFLDFEQPIAELETKIEELRRASSDADVNISDEIQRLEEKSQTLMESVFGGLTLWQISVLSRYSQCPHTLDYIDLIFEQFDDLHGDRNFADDPAIVGGIALLNDKPVMVIGYQKGR